MPTDSGGEPLSNNWRSSGEQVRRTSSISGSSLAGSSNKQQQQQQRRLTALFGRFIRTRSNSNPGSPVFGSDLFGFSLTEEPDEEKLLEELRETTNLTHKMKRVMYLVDVLRKYRLERLEEFWESVEELFDPGLPAGARQAGFFFISACLNAPQTPTTQNSSSSNLTAVAASTSLPQLEEADDDEKRRGLVVPLPLRIKFFRAIEDHEVAEDYELRFMTLKLLTRNGREIHGFEDRILSMLHKWTEQIMEMKPEEGSPYLVEIIRLLKEITLHHFALFPEKEMTRTVRSVCRLCSETVDANVAGICIEYIEALIERGQVPDQSLGSTVRLLCRYVISETYQMRAWTVFRCLLQSHQAFATLQELCRVTEDPTHSKQLLLLRGAVFFLSMTTWGSRNAAAPTSHSRLSFARVLSCIRRATVLPQPQVAHEVLITLNRIVRKFQSELSFVEWELFFDIVDQISALVESIGYNCAWLIGDDAVCNVWVPNKNDPMAMLLSTRLNVLLTLIQQSVQDKSFAGPVRRFLTILERLSDHLSENSALMYLDQQAQDNVYAPLWENAEETKAWLSLCKHLMKRWLIQEPRVEVKRAAIRLLAESCRTLMLFSADDETIIEPVLDELLGPLSREVAKEKDQNLAGELMNYLTEMTEYLAPYSQKFDYFLTRIQERLIRCMNCDCPGVVGCKSTSAAQCVWRLFEIALMQSPDWAISLFDQLVKVLRPSNAKSLHEEIRVYLLQGLLRLRVNHEHYFYLTAAADDEKIKVSPLLRSYASSSGSSNTSTPPLVFEHHELLKKDDASKQLPVNLYLELLLNLFQQEQSWALFALLIFQLPSQLMDKHVFCDFAEDVERLALYISKQLVQNTWGAQFRNRWTVQRERQDQLLVPAYRLISVFLSFKDTLSRSMLESLLSSFQTGLQSQAATLQPCLHALLQCLYEIPQLMSRCLPAILQRLSRIITSPDVSVHLLEFLSALAEVPQLYAANFVEQDYRLVFHVALQYIKYNNQLKSELTAFRQYVLVMAYRVIEVWFTRIRLSDRKRYVSFLVQNLSSAEEEHMETCLDHLARFCHSNARPTPPALPPSVEALLFSPSSVVITKHWLVHLSLLSIKCNRQTGWAQISVTRATGKTSWLVMLQNRPWFDSAMWEREVLISRLLQLDPPTVNSSSTSETPLPIESNPSNESSTEAVETTIWDPALMVLQLHGLPDTLNSTPVPLLPIPSDDDSCQRSISLLERTPVVDYHKIGVIYVGPLQQDEKTILSNQHGSLEYQTFISHLGSFLRLKGAEGYTGGLDRENNLDGEYSLTWQTQLTLVIFHTATLMPTRLEQDPSCTLKKRHIGNDFVTIVYNDSPLPYNFSTLPSQFNFTQIIVTPLRHFTGGSSLTPSSLQFLVKMQYRADLPAGQLGPALEPKLMSLASCALFVRQLALHANIYAQIYLQECEQQRRLEYISNWRERLRQLKRLRDRVLQKFEVSGNGEPTMVDFTRFT